MINIQHIPKLRKRNNKGEKQPESLSNYFLGILWKKKVFYQLQAHFKKLRNLEK